MGPDKPIEVRVSHGTTENYIGAVVDRGSHHWSGAVSVVEIYQGFGVYKLSYESNSPYSIMALMEFGVIRWTICL
jgi:hypothetical protein